MASNIINQLIYKPSTILEAITLTINVISVCISSPEIVGSWHSVNGSPVALLPIAIAFPMRTKTMGDY